MNKLLVFLICISLISLVSASLGTFKQGSCVDIKTILNATNVNISTINYPNLTVAVSNVQMTKIGLTFNYTFCNTLQLGQYVYDYFDYNGNVYVNDFQVTPTGEVFTQPQSTVMVVVIISLVIAVIFFFILGMLMKNKAVKIFLMAMAFLTIIVTVGFGVSAAQKYFSGISGSYGFFYTLLIILSGAGGICLILWLIVVSFKAFNKSRGRGGEEDD